MVHLSVKVSETKFLPNKNHLNLNGKMPIGTQRTQAKGQNKLKSRSLVFIVKPKISITIRVIKAK